MLNLVLLALAACVLPTASYAAGRSTPTFPALYVLASVAPAPGASTDLEFDAEALDAGGETARMTISIPSAYGVSLAHARRSTIGAAEVVTVPLGGGSASTFKGDVTVVDPNAYAASPAGQTCDPASHVAVWAVSVGNRKLAEKMTIPIAVDRTSAGYVLTACFDEEHVANRELSTFDFQIRNSFAFPRVRGRYLFDATVTPFTSDGAANEAASSSSGPITTCRSP